MNRKLVAMGAMPLVQSMSFANLHRKLMHHVSGAGEILQSDRLTPPNGES